MGTSQSSGGPGPAVPMVPPWTPELPEGSPGDMPAEEQEGLAPENEEGAPLAPPRPPIPIPIAPAARFAGARRSLGDFAGTGDAQAMRRGVGHYVRSGYGGSSTATRRLGGAAATASALGGALAAISGGRAAEPGSPLDPVLLAGKSVDEVMDAVVEAVRPPDGTQDAEAERAAIRDALSELLTRFPEADLLNLDPEQRVFAIERFAAMDVFRRFELDLGKTILEKAPSAATALSRLRQVRDYIRETVAAAFRRLRDAGRTLTGGRIGQVVRDALKDAFEVFEGYAE